MRSIAINWDSVWVRSLAIALGWQALMTVIGYVLHRTLATDPASVTWLSHTAQWDSGWFLSITSGDGYAANGATAVFYPLFPLTVILAHALSFQMLSVLATALLVNTLALWLAIVALIRIAEHFNVTRQKWLTVALFLAFPTAIFLHFFYAEAIFCALAFWAYLFALRRQWLRMAILLSLLMIVKIPALLVIGLCMLEFMRANGWSIKKVVNRQVLVFALVPLAFLGYGAYLQAARGDFLGMVHGYDMTTDWQYQRFNPFFPYTIVRAAGSVVYRVLGMNTDPWPLMLVNTVLPLLCLGLLAAVSLYCVLVLRGKALPLGIAGLVSIAFFTINSNVVSVHRYILPCFLLYVIPVLALHTRRWVPATLTVLAIGGVMLQLVLYAFFVSGRFAG